MMLHRAATPALLLLLGATLAQAGDLIIRQRITGDGESNSVREETQYLTATQRITDSEDSRLIIDLSAQSMTVANKAKKSFQVLSFEQIRQQTQAMRAQFDKLPPEAKKQLPDLDGDVTIKATGKTDTMLGHPVKQYAVTSGLASGDLWVTEDFLPPGDVGAWKDAMTTMSGPNGPGGKLAAALADLRGSQLRSSFTTKIGPRQMTVVTEVIEITSKSAPAEVTKPPAGFEKVAAR